MVEPQPLHSVAILGAGLTGLSVAALFARALPQLSVTLVEIPPDPAALADRLPGTWPSIHRFHQEIGLDPRALGTAALAVPRLGTRLTGWPGPEAWIHSFGETGRPLGTVPFHHLWVRAEAAGKAGAFHRYSRAGRSAEAERFAPGAADDDVEWGLSLDLDAYRVLLGRHCAALGVRRIAAERAEGVADTGKRRATLRIDGGQTVDADLFIDCSGPRALLLRSLSGTFESWDAWLPGGEYGVRRLGAPASLCDQAIGSTTGWRWCAPTPRGWVEWSSGAVPSSDGERVTLRSGRRPRPWIGNVLALGDAACAVDPLHTANLHLAHAGARLALSLLPGRGFGAAEIAEYNRRFEEQAVTLRDFLALHHLARTHRLTEATPSLAHTIEQFARRGRLAHREGDIVSRNSWIAALLGCGLRPQLSAAISGGHTLEAIGAHLRACES